MDEQIAGAGYIINFFENLLNLNAYYSELKRRILSIKTHISLEELVKEGSDQVSPDEIKNIRAAFHSLNSFIDLTYIQSQALKNKISSFEDKDLTNLYTETETGEIPDINKLHEYVIKINTAFVDDVMQKLLVDSKTYYEKLRNQT